MPRVVERISRWTRKTATFLVSRLRREAPRRARHPEDDLIYRLRHWPTLPRAAKSIDVHRVLAVMSNRPVNRRWLVNHTRLHAREIDLLLRRLKEQGALEIIDAGKYRPQAGAA